MSSPSTLAPGSPAADPSERGPLARWIASPWAPWAIVALALGLRFAALLVLGDPLGIHKVMAGGSVEWNWGYEQAAIAQSVAEGEGLADPFRKGTGPTAWASPAYPLMLGGLIHLFGGINPSVAWSLALVQSLCTSLTCWALFRLGRALHSREVGLMAGLLWAVHPMSIHLSVNLVWDSTMVALALTWFLAAMAERGPEARGRALVPIGVGYGCALLVNAAPLALAPLVVLFYLRPRPFGRAAGEPLLDWSGLRAAATVLGVAVLTASPWIVRNVVVMGTPQLRSNLGVELFVGNNDGAFGPFNGRIHPSYHEEEFQRFVELGEVAYSKEAGGRALEWIEEHPARFGRLTLERAKRFWFGPNPTDSIMLGTGFLQERDWMSWLKWIAHATLAVFAFAGMVTWRGRPGGITIVHGTAVLFPVVYYLTHVFERYRFPVEPVLTLAAAAFLVRLLLGRRAAGAILQD